MTQLMRWAHSNDSKTVVRASEINGIPSLVWTHGTVFSDGEDHFDALEHDLAAACHSHDLRQQRLRPCSFRVSSPHRARGLQP